MCHEEYLINVQRVQIVRVQLYEDQHNHGKDPINSESHIVFMGKLFTIYL